ncbi:formylglycine-generating enzyme family protein [uncultured Psychroserpens sp.]|uniref:formylglycine-generating enzyme family protein n=1 Tax=uncultured Psychroserpens sp. TaxID=255436 RepID=UPI00261A489A|nr:formylglycine-generating enzyme family protein [uncultured Psychroserpens sp.]
MNVLKTGISFFLICSLFSCKKEIDPFSDSKNQMIAITGGAFNMGDEFDSLNVSAQPIHNVIIQDFEISRYEISVQDFMLFVNATGYKTEAETEEWAYSYLYVNDSVRKWEKKNINWKNPGFKQSEEHPVTCVSWNDAKAYCEWISKKTKSLYRLPLEQEWEYISRNKGESIKYPWGNNLPDSKNANFADVSTPYPWANKSINDNYAFTSPTGSYSPNEAGIYDLAGNVWEWCENTIKSYKNEDIKNYENAKSMRGGSFHNKENAMRTAWRNYDYPNSRYFNLGFRIVKEIRK